MMTHTCFPLSLERGKGSEGVGGRCIDCLISMPDRCIDGSLSLPDHSRGNKNEIEV
jgi:hypothetical protein